jgi:hypothetical protein
LGSTFLARWRPSRRVLAATATLGAVGGGVALTSANQGCIYDSSLLDSSDAGLTSPSTCTTAQTPGPLVPPEPTTNTDTGYTNLTVVVAMQAIDIGVGVELDGAVPAPDAQPLTALSPQPHIGLNLDNECTCCGQPPSCNQPAADAGEICDDTQGRDNTGIKLFRELKSSGVTGNEDINQAMYAGEYGMLVVITGYNGGLNDTNVTVSILASNGIQGGGTAQHDGNDKWTVDPRYIYNGGASVGVDCAMQPSACEPLSDVTTSNGYVSCGVLVAPFTTAVPLTFGGRAAFGGAQMLLQEPYLVGTLVSATVNNSPTFGIQNGAIAGRWQSRDLLSNMATIPDPFSDAGAFLCGSDPIYAAGLKPFICEIQDISYSSNFDNKPTTQCDSVSMAFGFSAAPVQLGVVASAPPTPAGCPQANGGLFSDSCTSH